MDPKYHRRSIDQIMAQIINNVAIINGSSQLVERLLFAGNSVTPDFLSASMSRIRRASDSIVVNMKELAEIEDPVR